MRVGTVLSRVRARVKTEGIVCHRKHGERPAVGPGRSINEHKVQKEEQGRGRSNSETGGGGGEGRAGNPTIP